MEVRTFERDVLDKLHLQIPFLQYSDDVVIPYLLQFYGDFVRHKHTSDQTIFTSPGIDSFLDYLMFGLSRCFIWSFHSDGQTRAKGLTDRAAMEFAVGLINWGIS